MAPRLGRGPLAAELHQLSLTTLDECLAFLADGHPEFPVTLHECRKRLKRLRGLLRGCRPGLRKRTFTEQDRLLRDAGRLLASWREQIAQAGALRQLAAHFGLPEPRTPEEWASGAAAEGTASLELDSAVARRAAARLLERSREQVHTWVDLPDLPDVFARGVRDEWRRARQGYRASLRRPDADVLHEWRKHVKYHLHHVQLLRRKGHGGEPRIRDLKELGELLGDAHDLAELRQTLPSQGAEAPRWHALLRAREAELNLMALERGAPLFTEFPAALDEQIRRWR